MDGHHTQSAHSESLYRARGEAQMVSINNFKGSYDSVAARGAARRKLPTRQGTIESLHSRTKLIPISFSATSYELARATEQPRQLVNGKRPAPDATKRPTVPRRAVGRRWLSLYSAFMLSDKAG
jgi:hypothetical protein